MAKKNRNPRGQRTQEFKEQEIQRPDFSEIAVVTKTPDHSASFTSSVIMKNPDEVLEKQGRGDFKIYKELLRDDQVKSVFQQRRLALVSKEWEVLPATDSAADKEAAEFIQQQLENIDWDSKTDKMLYGVFYGYGVAECIWEQQEGKIGLKDIKVRSAKNFKFDNDGLLRFITKEQPRDGVKLPPNKFWNFNTGGDTDDNPYGEGLAKALYWPVFFKRHDVKYWLVFLEKFGMPTIKGEYPRGATPAEKDKIMEAMDAIHAETAVAFPKDTVVETIEASRSGTVDYSVMHQVMNAAISKIILSQTMTTDNGSSLSQAQVHAEVKDELVKADADLICNSFNQTVVKWLTAWNFPNANPPKVWRRTEEAPDTKEIAERDTKIFSLGYEPTQEYIDSTYGEGFIKKAEPEPAPGQEPALAGNFSEFNDGGLLARMLRHRQDQDQLRLAAREYGRQYDDLIGGRVNDIVALAEHTGDLETLKTALDELFAEEPAPETIEKVQRAGVVSRLMGAFRGQR